MDRCGLLAAIIAAQCGQIYLTGLLQSMERALFNAIQNKDLPAFWQQLIIFAAIAAAFMIVAVYQLYFNHGYRSAAALDDGTLRGALA